MAEEESDGESESDHWQPGLYDDKHSFVWKMATGVVDLLNPQPDERILDVGCGIGQLTVQIAESGADVVGVDSSAAMIEEAQRLHPGIDFQVGDANDLSFAKPFDAIFSNAALHWVQEPTKVATSLSRCVKTGGRLVVEFGGHGHVVVRRRCILGLAARVYVDTPAPRQARGWRQRKINRFADDCRT